jgi:hypothetical protein
MADLKNTVEHWEAALPRCKTPTSEQWLEAFRKVNPEECEASGDSVDTALYELQSACEDCCVGRISLDFPNSTHGDGCGVAVYVLPRGTTVMIPSATYELRGPRAEIYRGSDSWEMLKRASQLIFDDGDHGEIQDLDEDDTYDPDAETTCDGRTEVMRKWETAIRVAKQMKGPDGTTAAFDDSASAKREEMDSYW